MVKKMLMLILLSMLATLYGTAQKTILKKQVSDELFQSNTGPNKKHFVHLFSHFSIFINDAETEVETRFFKTNTWGIGMRYKYKISGWYSLGGDLYYRHWNYNLKQQGPVFPNAIKHDKENLIYDNMGMTFYQRINFFERGDFMGVFFDFGPYINYALDTRYVVMDKLDNSVYHAGESRTSYSDLDYTNRFNYGIKFRFGYNILSVKAGYRLSDLFKPAYDYPEFPRFELGIELGMF